MGESSNVAELAYSHPVVNICPLRTLVNLEYPEHLPRSGKLVRFYSVNPSEAPSSSRFRNFGRWSIRSAPDEHYSECGKQATAVAGSPRLEFRSESVNTATELPSV